jgi:digeranylgeranylglycerophospholipid reductase
VNYDFAVVGGGPAGCIAAREAVKRGDVILFEEHAVQPVHCAGLISSSGFKALKISKGDFVLNELRGARLYSPLGRVVEVKTRKVKAFAVDRSRFDRHLLDMTRSKGVMFENRGVKEISSGKITTAGRKRFSAGRVILATGTNYNLQKKMQLNCPKEFLIGAQYEMKVDCQPDMVELHFIVPDFFAWVIPLDGRARVGLCTKGNPTPHLESFIKRLGRQNRLRSARVLGRSYGVIPVFNPRLRTHYPCINIVGDAAGQVKATTGGGVVMGGIAAHHAWSDDYEALWRQSIGGDLALHLRIHRFVSRLSERNIERLFSITAESSRSLEKYGDMDYASKTLRGLLSNPAFTLKFLVHTPAFLLDLV